MGQRGPKPLPANVHRLRNNPSKKPYADLIDGVQPEVDIPDCPKHLLKEACEEWNRITPELEALGLISKIDRPALALYCQSWAWWVWHEELLQRDIDLAAARAAAHEVEQTDREAEALRAGETYIRQPYAGGDGFMLPTPNGSVTYNPHWVARKHYAREVDKFLASFGMSPSSRGRVTPSSNQLPLFGDGEQAKGSFSEF